MPPTRFLKNSGAPGPFPAFLSSESPDSQRVLERWSSIREHELWGRRTTQPAFLKFRDSTDFLSELKRWGRSSTKLSRSRISGDAKPLEHLSVQQTLSDVRLWSLQIPCLDSTEILFFERWDGGNHSRSAGLRLRIEVVCPRKYWDHGLSSLRYD